MAKLDDYRKWNGTIDELAKAASKILVSLGHKDITPPNARVIRDYAQRAILSRAERRGKEVHYGFQHLQELVAAKILVSEGVPLKKIADHFNRDRNIVLVTLGVRPSPNAARAKWQSMNVESSVPENHQLRLGESAGDYVMQRTFADTGQQEELKQTLNRLGTDTRKLKTKQIVQVSITNWCSIQIEKQKLRRLSPQEADDIGRAVSTILSDPDIKKGGTK